MNSPLPVAISSVLTGNRILLIKRIGGDYAGMWGLPGGKIESGEHVSDAAIREVMEESGIESQFKSQLGVVSEHLVENGKVIKHFLLHVCELAPLSADAVARAEGEPAWFELSSIDERKNDIIPSDYLMIEKMVKNKGKSYYECVIEKSGVSHFLRKFE